MLSSELIARSRETILVLMYCLSNGSSGAALLLSVTPFQVQAGQMYTKFSQASMNSSGVIFPFCAKVLVSLT